MRRILIVLLALCLTACASALPKPEVSLADVELIQAGLFEQRFKLKLRLSNPGQSEVVINGLNFELELNGQPFAKGQSDQGTTLPRLGETTLDVTATSNLAALLRQVAELRKRGGESLDYRLRGTLSLPGFGSLPFDRKGEVKLTALVR